MLSLYVYFKVTSRNASAARLAVERLFEAVGGLGVKAEFWRRQADAADGAQTWMTVFHDVQSDFEPQLLVLAAQSGLSQWASPLSVESFVRC